MSKSLKTIQTLAKIGKGISTIIFIFSIIGTVAALIAVSALAGLKDIQLDGKTVVSMVEATGTNFVTLIFTSATAIFSCIGSAIVAKFAMIYFANELEYGTPFTYDGAKELLRLGILAIAVPAVISIVSAIAFIITKLFWPPLAEMENSSPISIVIGIMLIVMSIVFKHGAELEEKLQIDI